jgi:toxin CcdB
MAMTQFDVFVNPVAGARSTFPYVVVLQSKLATIRNEIVVAPLTARAKLPGTMGRLMPVVAVEGREFVVVTGSLATLPLSDLKRQVTNLTEARSALLGAIDLLFYGI